MFLSIHLSIDYYHPLSTHLAVVLPDRPEQREDGVDPAHLVLVHGLAHHGPAHSDGGT